MKRNGLDTASLEFISDNSLLSCVQYPELEDVAWKNRLLLFQLEKLCLNL